MAGLLLIIQSFSEPMATPPSSPWLEEDECNGNPFDREPSEWFPDEDKHYETRGDPMDWGDPEERDDELPNPWLGGREEEEDEDSSMEYADNSDQSECESVNSIPMSLGSFSTQSSTYEC